MSDIAEFLTARWDELERIAQAAPPGPWTTAGPDTIAEWVVYDGEWAVAEARAYTEPHTLTKFRDPSYIDANATAFHIAANDPAYVLADIAAKRQTLALHGNRSEYQEQDQDGFDLPDAAICREDADAWPCGTVRLLAAPFADHPDYDPGWQQR